MKIIKPNLIERIQNITSAKSMELALKSHGIGVEKPSRAKQILYTSGAVVLSALVGGPFSQLQAQTNYETSPKYNWVVNLGGSVNFNPEDPNYGLRSIDDQLAQFGIPGETNKWDKTGSFNVSISRRLGKIKDYDVWAYGSYEQGKGPKNTDLAFENMPFPVPGVGMVPTNVNVRVNQKYGATILSAGLQGIGPNFWNRFQLTGQVSAGRVYFTSETEFHAALEQLGITEESFAKFEDQVWIGTVLAGLRIGLNERLSIDVKGGYSGIGTMEGIASGTQTGTLTTGGQTTPYSASAINKISGPVGVITLNIGLGGR